MSTEIKVIVKDSYIFVLSGGKLSIFDKNKILAVDGSNAIEDTPLWTPIKSTTKTSNITDFYVDKTKIDIFQDGKLESASFCYPTIHSSTVFLQPHKLFTMGPYIFRRLSKASNKFS